MEFKPENPLPPTPNLISQDSSPQDARITLLIEQHKKCGEEIKMRLEQEEVWFHYKFVFLGALLAGYLFRTLLKEPKGDQYEEFLSPKLLREVFGHVSTLILLGICCAVCIVLDMHIRANRIVINELGSWISNVAEPAIYGPDWDNSRVIGWEHFLRLSGGHHTDPAFHLLFWPEMFLVTVAVYASYSYVFFWQVRRQIRETNDERRLEERLQIGTYCLLHFLILVCALSTHYAPPNFRLRPWWWQSEEGLTPNQTILGYFALAVVAIAISFCTWMQTRRLCLPAEQGHRSYG